MRIAYFTQWFPPEPAAVVGALARELAERGHEVDVVTGFPNYPSGQVYPGHRIALRRREDLAPRLAVTRVPLYPSHDESAVRRIANYVSFGVSASTIGLRGRGSADVAYVYHPPLTSTWAPRLLEVLRGVPFVLHVQDLWPESVTQSAMVGGDRSTRIIERFLSRACLRTYRAASQIVVISPGFKRLLTERGVDADKVTVVSNWADEALFFPRQPDAAARAELAPPGTTRLLLYAGNLGHYQALDVAVRAAAGVDVPGFHLAIVGDGVARGAVEQVHAELRPANVSLHPPRRHDDVAALLAAADAHLISLVDLPFFASTIPGKTQVALACGRPAVVAVRGDAADLVGDARAGIACLPGVDGLTEAFQRFASLDDAALAEMGASGRRYYESRLSMTVAAPAFERVLAEAAGGRGVPR